MKKLLTALLLLPSAVMAHPGHGAHTHPEEMAGGLILLVAAAGAYYIWKNHNK